MLSNFHDLTNQVIGKIEGKVGDTKLIFTLSNGEQYALYHWQDCSEDVRIEDVCGDFNDLLNEPVLLAEKVTNSRTNPEDIDLKKYIVQDHFTWTFYKLATRKGYVTIRWYGESNGYYSEEVFWNAWPVPCTL